MATASVHSRVLAVNTYACVGECVCSRVSSKRVQSQMQIKNVKQEKSVNNVLLWQRPRFLLFIQYQYTTDNMMGFTHTCTQIMHHKDIIVSLNEREEDGEKQAGSHCVREENEGFMGIIPLAFQTNCFSWHAKYFISDLMHVRAKDWQVVLWPGGAMFDPSSHELPTDSACTEVNLRKALDLCQRRGELLLTAHSDLLWEAFRSKVELPPWKWKEAICGSFHPPVQLLPLKNEHNTVKLWKPDVTWRVCHVKFTTEEIFPKREKRRLRVC